MRHRPPRDFLLPPTIALALAATLGPARAARGPSELGELSAVPVALSIAAPLSVLATGASIIVVGVEVTAEGVVYVLERVGDGLRFSVKVAARTVEAASELAGQVVVVTMLTTGYLLSSAGRVICYVPNDIGRALVQTQQLTR